MDYRRLGNSGLKVSPICLGAMMFGDQTDEAVAGRIVDSAFGAGINFIDTADSYAKGGSERMVGKLIAKFNADDEALINELVAPGHASTPGYTDPKFPILGRVPRT